MTVAVDNTGQSAGGTSTASLSISSFAVGSGPNRVIFLSVSQYSTTDRVPSAVFDSLGVNLAFTVHDAVTIAEAPGTRRVTILKLPNPPNDTKDIKVTWSGTVNEVVIGADSWTDADQVTCFGTAVKNSGASGTSTSVAVPNAVGAVVHDAYSGDAGPSASVTGNQTQRWRAIAAANTTEGAGQSAAGTGSNITCTWSNLGVGSGTVFAHIGVAILQASSAAQTPSPLLATAIYPIGRGRIGPLAMVMRGLRPPQATGGAAFSDAVADTLTAAETETATAAFAVAAAETLTAADSETATAAFAVARAEALTTAETATGALSAVVAASEALTAADSSTGALAASTSLVETLAASDSETGAMAAVVARAESLSATDSQDATVISGGSTAAETLTVADSATATVAYAVAVAESLAAVDVVSEGSAAFIPPSPTRLSHSLVAHELSTVNFVNGILGYLPVNTHITALDEDGQAMATPLTFTAGETGPVTFKCEGADGSPENLATATSATLRVVGYNGVAIVDNVALTSGNADGTAVWTRQSGQVNVAGDYLYQVKVVRADATVGYYPDGQRGNPLTLLAAV